MIGHIRPASDPTRKSLDVHSSIQTDYAEQHFETLKLRLKRGDESPPATRHRREKKPDPPPPKSHPIVLNRISR